jgi:transcriptional regulator with XRE-family HTH domain
MCLLYEHTYYLVICYLGKYREEFNVRNINLFLFSTKCAFFPKIKMYIINENVQVAENVSVKLKSWREGNKLSIRKLAKICRLGESTIRHIEKGNSNMELSTLVKLRMAYNVKLIKIFDNSEDIPKIRITPIDLKEYDRLFAEEKINIGQRLEALRVHRKLDVQTFSILANNADYSDTHKYLDGAKNMELFTLLKYGKALEVDITVILDYNGALPSNEFIGKI